MSCRSAFKFLMIPRWKGGATCCCWCSLAPSDCAGVDDERASAWVVVKPANMSSKNLIPVLDAGHLSPCLPLCSTLGRWLEVRAGRREGVSPGLRVQPWRGADPPRASSAFRVPCPLWWTGDRQADSQGQAQQHQVNDNITSVSGILSQLKEGGTSQNPRDTDAAVQNSLLRESL